MAVDKRGRKLPNGIRQRYDDFEGRFMYKGERYLVHGKTITETQKAMTELRYKLEHGLFVEKKRITLDEWFDVWLEEYKKNQVKIGTYIRYRKTYEAMIKNEMGNNKIADIRAERVQKLFNNISEKGYSYSTIKLVRAILNSCMRRAVKNSMIERNPVELTDIPRSAEREQEAIDRKEQKALSCEQQALFMEYAKDSFLYNLFAVMLRTGMRTGEISGLNYSDIDKKQKVIHVKRTLKYDSITFDKRPEQIVKKTQQGKYGYFTDTPKSKCSIRDIPLLDGTLEILEKQKRSIYLQVENIDRFLFCDEYGEPLNSLRVQSEINRIVKKIRESGKEFPHVVQHTFRHTFATRAIEAGMKPQVLKTILGHSSLAMTMDLYSHVLPDTKAQEMEKIANIF